MSGFTTRVELHSATSEDYEILHVAMKQQGFLRTIKSDKGSIHELPTAEYNLTGNYNIQQVIDKAETAGKTTRMKYSILVTESNGRRWVGLNTTAKEY
jgi:hypothetical protein